jgi:hypothetical protein
MLCGARFDSMVRNFLEMFLRARQPLEFSHSQLSCPQYFHPTFNPFLKSKLIRFPRILTFGLCWV